MKTKSNFMRMYRKRCSVMLHDIAYLLNTDTGNLSRYEKGQRDPTPELILTYHILFGADIINLFHEQYTSLITKLISQSKSLIEQLKVEQPPKAELRIRYLLNIINRLSGEKHE